ncbi:pentatricopeptide repeat-containing protein-like [Dorcoceras hygrometricum]|nr:pentatricopeptide repeat-containing protein-like [Dorcoceras hygrometricum]
MNLTRLYFLNRFLKNFSFQARHFSGTIRDVNKVDLYLQRAKLIDSIRLCLRSNPHESSLVNLLSCPGVGSFVVANALRSAPSPDSALSLIEALRKVPHFTHTRHTLHALAKILANSGQTGKLRALVDAMNSGKFVNVFPVSFMDRMRWYAAAGNLDEVLSVWEEWRATLDKHPCTESYNLVLKLFVEKGMDSEAMKLLCRMIVEGALPNCRTYTVIIEHLVRLGYLDSALEIFQILPLMRIKRTLKQYSTLVEAFTRTDQLETAKILLHEMQADGILPGRAILLSLQKMKEFGYVDDTEELLPEMMPDERIKSIGYSVISHEDDDDGDDEDEGSGSVNQDNMAEFHLKPWLDPAALASALQQWGPEEVSALQDANFVWTNRFVCKLIRNFKSPETAWLFFCWVAHQPGYVHDVYTISRMITKLARHGCVQLGDAALNIFHNAETICGPLSQNGRLVLCSSLLRTMAKCQMNTEAMDKLEEMIMCGIFLDLQTFSGLMHHYALEGDIKTVQRLFGMVRQSDLEPDAYMYRILICAYCTCGRAALALRAFEDMRNSGFMTDAAAKEMLVKSLWKEGKLREAAAVEEVSEDVGDSIPLALPGHLFTVSAADLTRVHKIYSRCLKASEDKI